VLPDRIELSASPLPRVLCTDKFQAVTPTKYMYLGCCRGMGAHVLHIVHFRVISFPEAIEKGGPSPRRAALGDYAAFFSWDAAGHTAITVSRGGRPR